MVEVRIPDLDIDVEEVTISFWHVEVGDIVTEGTDIVEIISEKATMNIQAPCNGMLSEVMAVEGETVPVGEVIARIHEEE